MTYSSQERIAHVYRRLGIGVHPDLVASTATPEDAIARALDLSAPAAPRYEMEPPADRDEARDPAKAAPLITWWMNRMSSSARLIEERLVWFWHDHFATGLRKVPMPYLLHLQHQTLRDLATGSFRDLAHAMSTDPAMLFYLDGIQNSAEQGNENYAREVMELHTLGTGHYTQGDIEEATKATSGWVVNVPFNERIVRFAGDTPSWHPFFVPYRHVGGPKTILGETSNFAMAEFIDLLLEQTQTAEFIAGKLHLDLVGLPADRPTLDHLTSAWSVDTPTIELVEAVVSLPAFLADDAIRAKVRTPLERVVGFAQAFRSGNVPIEASAFLHAMAFLPLNPPNPAGFPSGSVLLGPFQLTHMFDLAGAIQDAPQGSVEELMARLGLFDLSFGTIETLEAVGDARMRTALALNTPEFALT